MKILNRYLIREMIGPTLLGFSFYTFIIMMKSLFDFAEMIIKRSLPLTTVIKLLGLSLPHIVVLTIPMSLLFGILIAVGRLSADSEIIAMRASGMTTRAIYKPVFLFSLVIFLLNLFLMNYVLPRGNHALQQLRAEIVSSSVEKEIRPRLFYDQYENWIIYINDVDSRTGEWRGVLLSDASDPSRQSVIIADSGRISLIPKSGEVWLDLKGTETHIFDPRKPERYDLSRNAAQRFLLIDRYSGRERLTSYPKSLRELSFSELVRELPNARRRSPEEYRQAVVEMHKKFSIPFACVAFGIVALPLGITNRRGGRSSGFSLSIAIILLYYIMISNGEDFARTGRLEPAVAMWAPNILLTLAGLWLMRRSHSDRGTAAGGLFAAIGRGTRALLPRRGTRATSQGDGVPFLRRLDIAFPNTIDRYILREFVKILGLVLVSTAVLFVIVDYTELADEISENRIRGDLVLSYYRYFIFQVLNWTIPISVLVATLVTFGIFSRNNEITAAKSNGISLYRLAIPVLAIAAVVCVVAYLLLDFVLPYANQRSRELKDTIKGRQVPASFSVEQRQWLFGHGRYMFNFLSFDKRRKSLSEVQVFELGENGLKLQRRVWAAEARFDGTSWVFVNGWIRSFDRGTTTFAEIREPVRMHYAERPEYFEREEKQPEQMNYAELRRYIRDLRKSGYAAEELAVELYGKTSWPFISLVMTLIALPFAFRVGKRGALYGVGIALFLAFGYWLIFGIFTKFGEVGNLPAVLSAWSANILFVIAALYMFLHVET